MATDREFVEDVLDRMLPLEVSSRAMFGGYALYLRGKTFALIGDNQLFIKIADAGGELAGRITKAPPYPGGKPAFRISRRRLDDRDWLIALVEATTNALPSPKPKSSRQLP